MRLDPAFWKVGSGSGAEEFRIRIPALYVTLALKLLYLKWSKTNKKEKRVQIGSWRGVIFKPGLWIRVVWSDPDPYTHLK